MCFTNLVEGVVADDSKSGPSYPSHRDDVEELIRNSRVLTGVVQAQ